MFPGPDVARKIWKDFWGTGAALPTSIVNVCVPASYSARDGRVTENNGLRIKAVVCNPGFYSDSLVEIMTYLLFSSISDF